MTFFARSPDDPKYRVFREVVEVEASEVLWAYLNDHADDGATRIPTTRLAEEALGLRGILPEGTRVDLVRHFFSEGGVPLDRHHRAILDGGTWRVYGKDVQGERLVDWNRRRRR